MTTICSSDAPGSVAMVHAVSTLVSSGTLSCSVKVIFSPAPSRSRSAKPSSWLTVICGMLLQAALRLELAVAGHGHDIDDHGGAELLRPGVGVEQAGAIGSRMAAAAGNEGAVDDRPPCL